MQGGNALVDVPVDDEPEISFLVVLSVVTMSVSVPAANRESAFGKGVGTRRE